MIRARPARLWLILLAGLATPAAADWWYVGHDAERALFVDEMPIRRDGDAVHYWTLAALHDANGPAGEIKSYMVANCKTRQIGWGLEAQFDRNDVQGDVSSKAAPDFAPAAPGTLDDAQLQFMCTPAYRVQNHLFAIAIDEIALTTALLSNGTAIRDAKALHDAMARDPAVPVIRSTAPATDTFGTVQTVKRGQPLVPPRDYQKGTQPPRYADYDRDTVGIIYDVAYDGVTKGEIQLEVRGYAGDDMVHPGSGQIDASPLGIKTITIRDLLFTIVKATPAAITYRVAHVPQQDAAPTDPGEPVDAALSQ